MKKVMLLILITSLSLFANQNGHQNLEKSLKANEWYVLSFPIQTEANISDLFPNEANGAELWHYDMNKNWNYTTLECNDGCKSNGSFTTLNTMEGFWIKPKVDFTLTYCANENQIVVDDNLSSEELSSEQKYALAYMWHEEKLAHDIYLELYKVQPLKQLSNIANNSEITHIDLIEQLVASYDINITNLQNYQINYSKEELSSLTIGEFVIPEIQNLYDELKAKGVNSTKDALEVGCMVEVTDVNDLNSYIEIAKDKSKIVEVFEKLKSDSYTHYWAFDSGLKSAGISEGCCILGSEYCKTKEEYPSNK